MYGQCRDCGDDIAWLITRNGKNIPVDVDSFEEDDVALIWETVDGRNGPEDRILFDRLMGMVCHFDTCEAKDKAPPKQAPRAKQQSRPTPGRGRKDRKESTYDTEFCDDEPQRPTGKTWSDEQAYEVLHLLPGAHAVVVKAAYRALSLLHHPDMNEGQDAEMKLINTAYEHLKTRGLAE